MNLPVNSSWLLKASYSSRNLFLGPQDIPTDLLQDQQEENFLQVPEDLFFDSDNNFPLYHYDSDSSDSSDFTNYSNYSTDNLFDLSSYNAIENKSNLLKNLLQKKESIIFVYNLCSAARNRSIIIFMSTLAYINVKEDMSTQHPILLNILTVMAFISAIYAIRGMEGRIFYAIALDKVCKQIKLLNPMDPLEIV